jgi:hypothetical protein
LQGTVYPRGFPYGVRTQSDPTIFHHGIWSNIPDLDAQTQKQIPSFRTEPSNAIDRVPYGAFFPMSSMNLAFKREGIPLLYFGLMGEDRFGRRWGYDRFDDIWAGLVLKKICDHQGWAVSSGRPSVFHAKASDVEINLVRESAGLADNEWLWEELAKLRISSSHYLDNYKEVAAHLPGFGRYWAELGKAMLVWISLFK